MTLDADQTRATDVDGRPRRLLERYLSLVGGTIVYATSDLADIVVPSAEAKWFGKSTQMRVAFSPAALEDDAAAEILVNGSDLLRRLVEAIQSRGALLSGGTIAATAAPTNSTSPLPLPHGEIVVLDTTTNLAMRPVGRLLARVSLHAGPALMERLVETDVVDFVSGSSIDSNVARWLVSQTHAAEDKISTMVSASELKTDDLLRLLLDDVERTVADDLAQAQRTAEEALASELARLHTYYEKMVDEAEDGAGEKEDVKDRKAAIRADRDRRKKEEQHRFTVRVTVHPIQLTRWLVPSEQVVWNLQSPQEKKASVHASRLLIGSDSWTLICPSCGESPDNIHICRHEHACCSACAGECSMCGESCCKQHGLGVCHVAQHAVCDVHVKTCRCCDQVHCESHGGRCDKFDHGVCASCEIVCGRCSTKVCKTHAIQTTATAPLGVRWLCSDCTVACEGGQNEPIGRDESVQCASCNAFICTTHQVTCVIDGRPHCSRHLRRSDRSGRLVCEQHRSACSYETHSVFAADEIVPCQTCGRFVCDAHGKHCDVDGHRHCVSHLRNLGKAKDVWLCEQHSGVCSVDNVVFRSSDLTSCPVCAKSVCRPHVTSCGYCGRPICASDFSSGRCKTCTRLVTNWDPDEALLHAAIAANDGEPPAKGEWRVAQDSQHFVVEINLGWTRKLVFTVRHGETEPDTIMRHSALGVTRKR